MIYAQKKTYERRYDICKKCPRFNKYLQQCKECYCIIPLKARLQNVKCPLGKWEEDKWQ